MVLLPLGIICDTEMEGEHATCLMISVILLRLAMVTRKYTTLNSI